jgi:putative toxin-antitoxin system antitoxin component (TIGR02293 family)
MDLYKLSKRGIPKIALVKLVHNIGTSMRAMAEVLHVTERTLQRKKDLDLLSEDVSEHIIQIAEVYMRGNQVFDNNDDFIAWMHAVNTALVNQKPNDLLSSRYGVQLILNELGRIEHGILS